jgi:hypothetical protein
LAVRSKRTSHLVVFKWLLFYIEKSASEISAQINASQSSNNRHISTSSVQRRLRESGLHGRIAARKPLVKDSN